jgi:para-nitrobenzyl esterase
VRLTSIAVMTAVLAGCSKPKAPAPEGSASASAPAAPEAPAAPAGELGGTSWQLVQRQSMDDTKLVPDERSKYTITFGTDGRASVRGDCNQGSGSWQSEGPNNLTFGPMAVTMAACPEGSMSDRFFRDFEYIRSYVMKDGHLYISLMADGGIYEFEPMPK